MASVFGTSMQKSIPAVRDTSRGRVLAIDYGTRRLGLALSDALRVTARPLATWTRTNRRRDLARLRDLCRLHEVDTIVVGWPLRLDGSEGDMANEARRFADRVRKHLGLHVELVDERLTSWQAEQPLDELAARTWPFRIRRERKSKTAGRGRCCGDPARLFVARLFRLASGAAPHEVTCAIVLRILHCSALVLAAGWILVSLYVSLPGLFRPRVFTLIFRVEHRGARFPAAGRTKQSCEIAGFSKRSTGRFRGQRTLQAGEYLFNHPVTSFDVFDTIANGRRFVRELVDPGRVFDVRYRGPGGARIVHLKTTSFWPPLAILH